jgi:hypothetical protein
MGIRAFAGYIQGMDDSAKPADPPAPAVPPAPPDKASPPRPGKARRAEIGGPQGPEPTRYGDWERNGRCIDF